MPNAGGHGPVPAVKDSGNKSDKDGKDNGKNRPDPNVKARAEGQSQFDYLQRLGDRIRQLDAELRFQGDRGIEAVGVLGSDLYDKLLCCRRCARCCRTHGSSPPISMPCCCIPASKTSLATSWSLRDSVCSCDRMFREPFRRFAATTRPASFSPPALRSGAQMDQTMLVEFASAVRDRQFARIPVLRDASSGFPRVQGSFARLRRRASCKGRPRTPALPLVAKPRRTDHDVCKDELMRCRLVQPIATAMLPQFSRPASIGLVGVAFLSGLDSWVFPWPCED